MFVMRPWMGAVRNMGSDIFDSVMFMFMFALMFVFVLIVVFIFMFMFIFMLDNEADVDVDNEELDSCLISNCRDLAMTTSCYEYKCKYKCEHSKNCNII